VQVGAAPTLFAQVAYGEQPPLFAPHSLMSLQLFWSAASWYHVLHAHAYEPPLLLQTCAQPPLFVLHSFTSTHVGFAPPLET
jgi:hypothetical protein